MLNQHEIHPKKSLGQNFLIDKNISKKIVNLLDCRSNDNIVEIGPGTGALTEFLLQNPIKLIAIEIDSKAVDLLNKKFNANKNNLKIIHSDILDIKLKELYLKENWDEYSKVKVIGNIPYYLSSDIFFWLFEQASLIEKAVLMVQKEVAKRLSAPLRTKDYGILTVAVNLIGKSKIMFDVSPTCFYPQPKVTSSIIEITFDSNSKNTENFKSLMKLIRASFNQRRKVLRNSLMSYVNDNVKIPINDVTALAENDGIDYFSKRAEELSSDDFIKLFEFFQKIK